MTPLHILHLTAFVGKCSFGIGPVSLNLARGQQELVHQAAIWPCDVESEACDFVGLHP